MMTAVHTVKVLLAMWPTPVLSTVNTTDFPVLHFVSLNFVVRVTKPSIKDKTFEKRAVIHT